MLAGQRGFAWVAAVPCVGGWNAGRAVQRVSSVTITQRMNNVVSNYRLSLQMDIQAVGTVRSLFIALFQSQQLKILGNKMRLEAFLISTDDEVPDRFSV